MSLWVARQPTHITFGQALVSRICGEMPLMIPRDDAHFGARPQITLRILIEAGETIAAKTGRDAFVEDGEAHAIKARQPIKRGNPEIAFRRLLNGGDDVLREAGVRRPVIEAVLGHRRRNKDRGQQATQAQQNEVPSPDTHWKLRGSVGLLQ